MSFDLDLSSVKDTQCMIKKAEMIIKKTFQQYPKVPKIILLGNKKSGKSSVKDCLLGNNPIIALGAGKRVLLQSTNSDKERKNDFNDENIYFDKQKKLLFCDCPGFNSDQGFNNQNELLKDIYDSIIIDKIFQENSKDDNFYKILIVISASDFDDIRGQNIVFLLNRIQRMFPKPEALLNKIGIVITKGDSEFTVNDYITQINEEAPEELMQINNYFLNKTDLLFTFPKASRKNVGKLYEFEDKERLLSFIKSDYIINPEHQPSFAQPSIKMVKDMNILHSQKIDNIMCQIFKEIAKQYQHEKNIDGFDNWLFLIKKMENSNIDNSKDFQLFVQSNFVEIPKLEQKIKEIENYEKVDFSLNLMLNLEYKSCFRKIVCIYIKKTISEIENLIKKSQEIKQKQEIIDEKEKIQKKYEKEEESNEKVMKEYIQKLEEDQLIAEKQQEEIKLLKQRKQIMEEQIRQQKLEQRKQRLEEQENQKKERQEIQIKNVNEQKKVNELEEYDDSDILYDQGSSNSQIFNEQKLIEDRIEFENEKKSWEQKINEEEDQIFKAKLQLQKDWQEMQKKAWEEETRLYNERNLKKGCLLI